MGGSRLEGVRGRPRGKQASRRGPFSEKARRERDALLMHVYARGRARACTRVCAHTRTMTSEALLPRPAGFLLL